MELIAGLFFVGYALLIYNLLNVQGTHRCVDCRRIYFDTKKCDRCGSDKRAGI